MSANFVRYSTSSEETYSLVILEADNMFKVLSGSPEVSAKHVNILPANFTLEEIEQTKDEVLEALRKGWEDVISGQTIPASKLRDAFNSDD